MSTVEDTVESKDDGVKLPEPEPESDGPFKKPTFAAPSVVGKRRSQPTCSNKEEATSSAPDTQVVSSASEDVEKKDTDPQNGQEPQEPGASAPMETSEAVPAESKTSTEPAQGKGNNTTRPSGTTRVRDIKQKPTVPLKPNPPLPYTEPEWGGVAEVPYALEILKNGAIVSSVPLTHQGYFVIGRLPGCDVTLEHPSISRYHAILQYRGQSEDGEDTGFYVHDLSSTHGTFVNKRKVPPKTYIRLKVGHVLKFGGSTRLFILQVPLSVISLHCVICTAFHRWFSCVI